jgi:macrolide transport system ATP-binding/permease protein
MPTPAAAPEPPPTALVAQDIGRAFGDRVVLDGVDLVANPAEPVGLVGENGVGKSTLMRILAGADEADSGTVSRPEDTAYLGQEADFAPGATVGDVLAEVLAPLHDAVARLESLAGLLGGDTEAAHNAEITEEYATLLAWAEHHDAWDADRRAEVAAAELGVGHLPHDRPVAELSGGERTRLALAAIIVRRPDCVLLDEPTNHLDDEAMAHIEEFVLSSPGVVVVASHDRVFLDRTAAVVVDLDPSYFGIDGEGGSRFSGDFTAYLGARRKARRRWEEAFLAQREELGALRLAEQTTARTVAHDRGPRDNDKSIYKFKGAKVARSVARRVHDVQRRIEVLERAQIPKPPRPLTFGGRLAEGPGSVLVRDLVVPGRVEVPTLTVEPGEHLLVTGPNGSGK